MDSIKSFPIYEYSFETSECYIVTDILCTNVPGLYMAVFRTITCVTYHPFLSGDYLPYLNTHITNINIY